VGQWSYLAVMAFIVLGAGWLEVGLRTRVLRRWRRLLLSVLPVALVFALWDIYAIASGHWWFDEALITGIRLPGELPVDEVVFFLLVPVAAILTLEAVRSATGLPVGDEAPGDGAPDGAPHGDAGELP
jgi:lycopene cyclase domain-containing protein